MNVDTDTQWTYWEGVKDFYQVSQSVAHYGVYLASMLAVMVLAARNTFRLSCERENWDKSVKSVC